MLTRCDGMLHVERIADLVAQIAALHKKGLDIVMISSGAVAAGRGIVKPLKKLDTVSSRQLYSAAGQAQLINHYFELFRAHGLVCGQVLTTRENFSSRTHYLNQKHCMDVMLENGVIPVVNENDTVSVTELMFTDNDELSGLVATMMGMDVLIILSNVDGIYDGDPSLAESKVIREVAGKMDVSLFIQSGKSLFGRGGMITKYKIARQVAGEGIRVIIANGTKSNILIDLVDGKPVPCTRFLPAEKTVSSVKKWVAHSGGFAKGEVCIDEGAEKALFEAKATSILFVGITGINGSFKKNDLVKIINHAGEPLGVGRAAYDSEKAVLLVGKRNARPMIHYDYLYLD